MDTNVRKQKALSEFNLRQNSVFWNARENSLRTEKLAAYVVVPKSTIQEWYAHWKDDNNTTLAEMPKMLRSEGLRRRGLYFQELKDDNKITVIQAAVKYGVSRSAIRLWRREFEKENNLKLSHNVGGRKPFLNIENIQGEKEVKVIMTQQKEIALREFNLKEKSKFWDADTHTVNCGKLATLAGVSYCTMFDWYSIWKFDNNTKLETRKRISDKEMEDRKFSYFNELTDGHCGSSFEDARKFGVSTETVKSWRKQFAKNGGKVVWQVHTKKNKKVVDSKSVKSIEPKKVVEKPQEDEVPRYDVVIDLSQENLPQKSVENSVKPIVNTNGKSDVETLDNFFESIAKSQEKMAQLESDNKRLVVEIKSYKEKCAKWAAQVVTLQNAMAVKG